ncbi:glycerate kinase [Malaya genurostris]|uniref:glycerate kinase n=1 Tax=Malaya genurostris TaxID=325434 RepID=UPI0026F3DB4A|nr:glycerate kinase [Malaya genurostris]
MYVHRCLNLYKVLILKLSFQNPNILMISWLRNCSKLKSVGYRLQHHVTPAMQCTLNALFQCAVDSVKPKTLFKSFLANGDVSDQLQIPGKRYHLVGFGKAVLGMAVQLEKVLGDRLHSGIISIPVGTLERFEHDEDFKLNSSTRLKVLECARNNLPDVDSIDAARKIKKLAESMTREDVLCVLVSGGGSALLSLPTAPITLSEKLLVIKKLAAAGASIDELNVVRIKLSNVKGGKLALAAENSFNLISFVISDIIGDPLPLIASGPTVKSCATNIDALKILEKYNLVDILPDSVMQVLNATETNLSEQHLTGKIHLIGSNITAIDCILGKAKEFGLNAMAISNRVQGNVKDLSEAYIKLATAFIRFHSQELDKLGFSKQIYHIKNLLCFDQSKVSELEDLLTNGNGEDILLVAGGEPTVVVQGNGIGGRNQELALRFSQKCFQQKELLQDVILLSAGTDGIDGPTDAAGAIGKASVIEQYFQQGIDKTVEDFISDNDSYNFYRMVQDGNYHIVTGHTGTNVMDIHMLYIPLSRLKINKTK